MNAREELAAELAEHRLVTPVQCACGWRETDPECEGTHAEHVTDALLVSPALADLIREKQAEALREVAAWVADRVGFPVEVSMPGAQPPSALWEAIVDHVHADTTGSWHGNDLAREDVDSWLRDEAGMPCRADQAEGGA